MARHALAALAVLALAACSSGGSNPQVARVGAVAPAFTEVTASGAKLSLERYRGKAVYLNFFATWCPPCNAEAPTINALQKKYAARGLQVIGVDELENAAKAQGFIKRYGLVYPAVVDDGALETQYSVNGLPVHVFITRAGVIQKIRAGEMNKAQIESSIHALL
jgi:cytochrome c biogenesis protein CcmG/thiol:disulfide interchange protein DsbE